MYKRPPPPQSRGKKPKATPDLGMFGLPDLTNLMGDGGEDDDDVEDEDLEAELHRLLSGEEPAKRQSKQPLKPALNLEEINKMATKIIESDSDDETADSDEKLLKDPALLAELASLAGEDSSPSPPARQQPAEVVRPAPPPPAQLSTAPTQAPSLAQILQDRLTNYQNAVKAAKELEDSAKVRRFSRAIKTLESQIKAARAGRSVPEDDIPPQVAIPKAAAPGSTIAAPIITDSPELPASVEPEKPPAPPPRMSRTEQVEVGPPRPAPPPPPVPPRAESSPQASTSRAQPVSHPDTAKVLEERRDQYRHSALKAKTLGDPKKALAFMKTAKQFDAVLGALKNNQPIDLHNMPNPPPAEYLVEYQCPIVPPRPVPSAPVATATIQQSAAPSSSPQPPEITELIDLNEPEDPSLYKAPPAPATVLEALEQRLAKYRGTLAEAQSSENAGKVRRINRIVKQYEDSIRLHKAGRPVEYESLPCPPGFGPIPVPTPSAPPATTKAPVATPQAPTKAPIAAPQLPNKASIAAPLPPPEKAPVANPQPSMVKPSVSPPQPLPRPPLQHQASRTSSGHSIQEKQLSFLLERQTLFKQAALESKRKGDLEQAKEYLRKSKGLEPMIDASRCGLPIDASTMKNVLTSKDHQALLAISNQKGRTIPTPPQIQDQFVVVETADCTEHSSEEMFRQLERELTHQIEICERNKQHFLKLGDVSSATKFEKLALNTTKDLNVVLNLWKRGDPLPRFHYETRDLSIVLSHPDLSSSELEVKVIRGIDLPGKADELDTYVRIELPLPSSENPQKNKTSTVRDTTNPEFNQAFKFEINRNRSLIRSFKRCAVKCEVWSKGGFFRSDALIGAAQIKLVDLEKTCTIHESFDLLQNRKPTGGKLEVMVRIREPLVGKQVEEVKERWLIIG